uniref:Uncharacterized protein n=1 Tax=Glossina pallidipes TaxID=7398 RepID=A0A1A9Z276_GLOPL
MDCTKFEPCRNYSISTVAFVFAAVSKKAAVEWDDYQFGIAFGFRLSTVLLAYYLDKAAEDLEPLKKPKYIRIQTNKNCPLKTLACINSPKVVITVSCIKSLQAMGDVKPY